MTLDSLIASPHRRSQTQTAFSVAPVKRQFSRAHDLGSCAVLLKRHSFLLTALAILACLCTVYLYFAVTLGSTNSCSGLAAAQKVSCQLQHVKDSMAKGKLKFF